jgi:hypothetical protein
MEFNGIVLKTYSWQVTGAVQFETPKELSFRSAAFPREESAVFAAGSKADSSPVKPASE